MKNVFFILSMAFFFTSCHKEKKLIPSAPVASNAAGSVAPHTNFIFSGSMYVEKYDSTGNPVTNYTVYLVASKMVGTTPNYTLSTTFDGSNLKGEVKNEIAVEIPSHEFFNLTSGSGIFINGVINGFFSNDSLKYRAYVQGANNNNVYVNYSGQLTNSF